MFKLKSLNEDDDQTYMDDIHLLDWSNNTGLVDGFIGHPEEWEITVDLQRRQPAQGYHWYIVIVIHLWAVDRQVTWFAGELDGCWVKQVTW